MLGEPLSSHQRFGLAMFFAIGIATFVFGAIRLNKIIHLPFVKHGVAGSHKTAEDIERERIAELQNADTDKDGLSDYDELYVFRTSPFLEDSDSDGVSDGNEVAAETDPNCPAGQTCRQVSLNPTNEENTSATASRSGQIGSQASTTNNEKTLEVLVEFFGDVESLTPEKLASELQKMSGDRMRLFFVKLGIPEDAIRNTSDENLRSLLSETLRDLLST